MTREEAVKILKEERWYMSRYSEEYKVAYDMAIEALSAEAVQGEWAWSDEDASWKCDCCDCVFEEIDWKPDYNFCPNCGARMRGEGSE